ncbi:MAG: hypothetical protein AAB965_02970 [Patescibacteria group bacterium]
MNCIATENILDYFVDNRLTEHPTKKVRSHLEHCLSCSKKASLLHNLKKELKQLEWPVMLAHLRNAIYNRAFSGDFASAQRFNWKLAPAYRFAFAYLIFMIAASFFSIGLPSQLLASEVEPHFIGGKNG